MILNDYSKMFGAVFKHTPAIIPPSTLTPVNINDENTYHIMGQFNNEEPIMVYSNIPLGQTFVLKFNSSIESHIIFFGDNGKQFKLYATK